MPGRRRLRPFAWTCASPPSIATRQGPLARAPAARRSREGRLFPGRPALRDRERALGLRPGRAAAPAEDQVPDADAQRSAGAPRDPLRRRRPARSRSRTAGARCRAPISRPARGGSRSKPSSRSFMPRELRGPPKVLAAPDGFRFIEFASRLRLAHQPRERRRRRGRWSARRSTRCASAATSMSRGSRPGASSTSSAACSRRRPGCGSR